MLSSKILFVTPQAFYIRYSSYRKAGTFICNIAGGSWYLHSVDLQDVLRISGVTDVEIVSQPQVSRFLWTSSIGIFEPLILGAKSFSFKSKSPLSLPRNNRRVIESWPLIKRRLRFNLKVRRHRSYFIIGVVATTSFPTLYTTFTLQPFDTHQCSESSQWKINSFAIHTFSEDLLCTN